MTRILALTVALGVACWTQSASAQSWTYGYTPVYGGYTVVAPTYGSYSAYRPATPYYGMVAPRPAYVYSPPAAVRPWPNYSYWTNAGYPYRTYSYYANFSGAFPTYGYIYGYPYYAAGYRAYVW